MTCGRLAQPAQIRSHKRLTDASFGILQAANVLRGLAGGQQAAGKGTDAVRPGWRLGAKEQAQGVGRGVSPYTTPCTYTHSQSGNRVCIQTAALSGLCAATSTACMTPPSPPASPFRLPLAPQTPL
eukprot:355364-Chlamydomonas_euryale.AAC.1